MYRKFNKFGIIEESMHNLEKIMSENKMLNAYRTILNHAKNGLTTLEEKSWPALKKFIEKAEHTDAQFAALSQKEFKQVQKDVQADIDAVAKYMADVEQGVEDFVTMELPVLEQLLIDKALSLSDPTEIMVLRLRLAAAMEK
jgi:hypothetical protein